MRKLRSILSGELSIKLQLDFLLRNNNTDIGVLQKIKVRFLIDLGIVMLELYFTFTLTFLYIFFIYLLHTISLFVRYGFFE
jgi:hypothetical protein